MPKLVQDEYHANADFALGYEEMDGYVDLYDYFSETAAKYTMTPIDVDVTVFKANQIAPVQPNDYYWGQYIRGALNLRFVPGDHHTMFYPEFIPQLAEQVRAALSDAERAPGS
jgi:thioesterase domain-containing protein